MANNLSQNLQQLNLSAHEADVYLALMDFSQTSAGNIIKKTALHRSVVYESLNKLIDKKLAFRLEKNNIAYFQATNPERILENIKSQEDIAQQVLQDLMKYKSSGLPEITVYEGLQSYQRFWIESVKRMPVGATDYVAGSIGAVWMNYLGPITKQYFKIAAKRHIGWKMIVFDVDDAEQSFLKRYPDFRWECRLINKNVSKEGNFNIFGNESVILHSATEPMIIEVKNKSLVKVFQNLFDVLWESGKKM